MLLHVDRRGREGEEKKRDRKSEDCSHFSLFLSALFVFFLSLFSCAHLGMGNERVGRFQFELDPMHPYGTLCVSVCVCVYVNSNKEEVKVFFTFASLPHKRERMNGYG